MQTIYIDTFFSLNLFINYLILYLVRKFLRINSKSIRLIFGAIFGALIAFLVFLPCYNMTFSIIYKILSTVFIIVISFGKAKLRTSLVRILTFVGISLIFSGSVTLIWLVFKPAGIVIYNDTVYFDISPALLILCTVFVFISLNIYEKLKIKLCKGTKVHNITIYTDSGKSSFASLVDTGCNIREPFSGLPVIIAEKELFSENEINNQKLRVIPYNTLSGEGMLKGFKPNKIDIDGKEVKNGCYVALSDNKLKGETKSLMGTDFWEAI